MLELREISFTYPDGTRVLHDVNIELPREHIVGILGKSGSGKTTMLRCLGRFVKPQQGRILLDGADIQGMEEREFRSRIGIVFQQLHLFPHMSVLDNVMLAPLVVQKQDAAQVEPAARETLSRLGVEELADKYPAEISGGQAQRVAIARALMLKPDYLLLDEPTSALDIQTSREFGEWLRDLQSDTTFVIVTHDVPFVEGIASFGVMLEKGRVREQGEIAKIVQHLDTTNS